MCFNRDKIPEKPLFDDDLYPELFEIWRTKFLSKVEEI